MSDRTTDIIYGLTGQTVETYPPEWLAGVTLAGTASVYAGDRSLDDAAEFSPSVTTDTTTVSLNAASGYSQSDRTKVWVATVANVTVGRRYRLANTGGQAELIVPKFKNASGANYVLLESPLAYDYASGDSFTGLRLSFTVDPTWVATESKINGGPSPVGVGGDSWGNANTGGVRPSYKVVWSYTINSIARRHYTYLRLVRQIAKHGVTIADLREYFPDLPYEEPAGVRGQQFAWAIDAAYDRVRADIITNGYQPEQIRDTELVDELVRAKTLHILATIGISPGGRDVEAYVEERRKEYVALFLRIIEGLKVPIDQGTEGAVTSQPNRAFWFRR